MGMYRRVAILAVAATAVAALLPLLAAASSSRVASGPTPGANILVGVSCPSLGQCTAVDQAEREVTFQPHSTAHTWRHRLFPPLHGSLAVSCPSTSLCAGVSGQIFLTFRPRSGRILRRWRIRHTMADAVTCVSASQCTAVGSNGRQVTFNPRTGRTTSNSQVATLQGGQWLHAVACPSRAQCTAIFHDSTGDLPGYEVTFDPISGTANAAGVALVGANSLQGLSCASTSQCTVIAYLGREATFDPRSAQPNAAGPVQTPLTGGVGAVSCPSLDQCSATERPGFVVTFDPTTGVANAAGLLRFRTGKNGTFIDCPTANQCTTVGSDGREATFNPSSGVGTVHWIDH